MENSYEATQRNYAGSILRKLALGIDPNSSEKLLGHEVLQHPDVIRALILACESLDDSTLQQHLAGRAKLRSRAGKPWLQDEDRQLMDEFRRHLDLGAIAEMHARTRGSIASRLEHLKLIAPRGDT